MDIYPQDEELPDLLVDLSAIQTNGACEGDLSGKGGCQCDGCGEEVFEEGGLDALCEGMGDGEFCHVILLFAEGDEVVVDPRLVLPRVVEVEVLGLHVVGAEFLGFEFRDFFQETLFLL